MTCILNHNEKKKDHQNQKKQNGRERLILGYEVNILFITKTNIIWDTYEQQCFF